MNNRKFFVVAFLVGMGSLNNVYAGAFFGTEIDNGDQSLLFAGTQTEKNLFVSLFAGKLKYRYTETSQNVEVESNTLTPTVGYRFSGPVTLSIAAGATWEEKQERRITSHTQSSTSAFAQLGAFYWKPEKMGEFLLSYTEKSNFFWSRVRAKHRVLDRIFAGGEVFKMGNRDVDSSGIGALIERQWTGFSSTLKAGLNDTSESGRGVYGGIEFYIPF